MSWPLDGSRVFLHSVIANMQFFSDSACRGTSRAIFQATVYLISGREKQAPFFCHFPSACSDLICCLSSP